MDRVADALRAGGHTIGRQSSGHVQASCPLHEDRKPSLSIDQRGERAFLHCHSQRGCTEREMAEAIGLRFDELWDEPCEPCSSCGKLTMRAPDGQWLHARCGGGWTGLPAKRAPRPKRVGALPKRLRTSPAAVVVDAPAPIATYEHVTLDGEVVAESIRLAGTQRVDDELHPVKDFRQRYADGKGGWASSKPTGLVVPLWRLPEITNAITQRTRIFLTEGHKDAAAAIEAGGEATTSITSSELTAEVAEQLRDAHVMIVCDRDRAGYNRGLKVDDLLRDVAGRVQLALPAPDEPKSDLTDHLDRGYTFDQLVIITRAQLTALAEAAAAAQILDRIEEALDEVRLQRDRGAQASDELAQGVTSAALTKTVAESERHATRWAIEAGRQLVKLPTLAGTTGGHTVEHQQVLGVLDRARDLTRQAYEISDTDPDPEIAAVLSPPAAEIHQAFEDANHESNVVSLPGTRWRPEHPISSPTRQEWAYSELEGRRGVYAFTRLGTDDPGRWQIMAPLPFVACRVVRRDGESRRLATDYRIATTAAGTYITVDHVTVRSGAWANEVGVPLSDDPKVVAAAGTALRLVAAEAPEKEAVVAIDADTDLLTLPHEAPSGFFQSAPVDDETAIANWRAVIALLTPKMAHVVAAAVIAPFIKPCGIRSHVLSLTGAPGQGKSTTLLTAAAVWGNPFGPSSLRNSWNTSPQGVPRMLGELRILPHFRDEAALARLEPAQWGNLLYGILEGNSRTTPDRNDGHRTSKPWNGILFSAGNSELTRGLGSGPYQGVPRRTFEFETPFTASRNDARQIHPENADPTTPGLLSSCYGHLGSLVARTITASQARDLIATAHQQLVCPPGAEDIAAMLAAHLAGALIVDGLLGDNQLHDLALTAAQDYLDQWQPTETEADRVLELINSSLDSEPSRWPSRAEYVENLLPFSVDSADTDRTRLPQAGVAREILGVRVDDCTVWVLSDGWKDLVVSTDINAQVACRQLHQRGILQCSDQARRDGDFTMVQRLRDSRRSRVHVLRLPDLDEDTLTPPVRPEPAPVAPTLPDDAPVTGYTPPCHGSVTGDVTGTKPVLTRGVTGVTGKSMASSCSARGSTVDSSRPAGQWTAADGTDHTREWAAEAGGCTECGISCSIILDGERIHPLCFERRTTPAQHPRGHTTTTAAVPAKQPAAAPSPSGRADESVPPANNSFRPDPRWAGPAAVIDAERAHLPGGRTEAWQAAHLGELALLTAERSGWALGCGGDTHRLPVPGQLWLTDAAVTALGFPTRVAWPTEHVDGFDSRTLFAQFDNHPMVTAAQAEGWEISGDHLREWTRISHPELLRRGAHLVFTGWENTAATSLTADQPAPDVLADRLDRLAQALGVPYLMTPATTATRLIDYTRPPLREGYEFRGRGLTPLTYGTAPEVPPFLQNRADSRFVNVETDWLSWRLWEPVARSSHGLLTDSERSCTYVHGYDRGASYLANWERLDLGLDGLQHLTGDAAQWDGSAKAGYWLVSDWEWPSWALPDPANSAPARVEDGRRWVTTHTLRQLALLDVDPEIHEAYTWTRHGGYLDLAAQSLKRARQQFKIDAPDRQLADVVKNIYTAGGGKLAQLSARRDHHLNRPDWWQHIVAASRSAVLYTLHKNLTMSGQAPLAVDHDAIFYASTDPDPISAWPGDPAKLGTTPGSWDPLGTARLAEWGPKYLVDQTPMTGHKGFRTWKYGPAKDDLTKGTTA